MTTLSFLGYRIASGPSAMTIYGLILIAGGAWNLWPGLRANGEFRGMGGLPPADREHPLTYAFFLALYLLLVLVGLYMAISGFVGQEPF